MSRLIKSNWPTVEEKGNKIISIKSFKDEYQEEPGLQNQAPTYEQSKEIIRNARSEADSIIAEAHAHKAAIEDLMQQERLHLEQELVQLSQQAEQNGFQAGYEDGRNQGYQEALGYIHEARQTVDVSKMDYQKKIEYAEYTILNLGLKVAEKILGEELTSGPESFLHVVKRALKEAKEYPEVQLHIHPSHYEFLLAQKNDLMAVFPKETELYIYPDPDLSEFSCIIESASGRIDASVDIQLEEIKLKLLELLESE